MKLLTVFLFVLAASGLLSARQSNMALQSPKSDVLLQGFYWNSPPGAVWWDSLASLAPHLASAGFGAIWFPSPVKGSSGSYSMGYDPYDHFDLGEFNQKGSIPTRFGSKDQLRRSIRVFHELGVDVYADAVMNHMNGGEQFVPVDCKPFPSYPDSQWLVFNYPNGSQRFPKNAASFYPNQQTCNVDPPYHGADDPAYQFGDWLAKDKQSVRDSLIVWGEWLKDEIGFDGFRLDACKAIDPAFMGSWLAGANGTDYAVAEYYGSTSEIINWLNSTKGNGGTVSMFDFPLRFTLQDMCNSTSGSFDMRTLDAAGLVNSGVSGYDVATFVENHDLDRTGYDGEIDGPGHNPIISDKMLAYAYILFSEGRPCVFFRDYFMYGLQSSIDSLLWIRQHVVAGGTTKRSSLNPWYIREDGNTDQNALAADLYVAKRNGLDTIPQAYIVMNDNSTHWIDVWIDTDLPVGTVLKDYTGRDANKIVTTPAFEGGSNRIKLWAPRRSYTIYVPDTTQNINHPPAIRHTDPLSIYTLSPFSLQVHVSDADGEELLYSLPDAPGWMTISQTGMMSGVPSLADTGVFPLIARAEDPHGASASDTTSITVMLNRLPGIETIPDTTISVTRRYEYQVSASDPDDDPLSWSFLQSPDWLNVGTADGLLSGTPSVGDTGAYSIELRVDDGKGGSDTTAFVLTVSPTLDTVVATYGKPVIDGDVTSSQHDWLEAWRVAEDDSSDSAWWPDSVSRNNELFGLFVTWDADTLYVGVDYFCTDLYNTMMIYVDAGVPDGVTNFNSAEGYSGPYPKHNRFRGDDGIDLFAAAYYLDAPTVFRSIGDSVVSLGSKAHARRGAGGNDAEIALSWNDIYGLGEGIVPPEISLKLVALVAGGENYGSGDAMPDNPDVDGNEGPDSLLTFITVLPDTNGDGIPDPTVYIDTVITGEVTTSVAYERGWNIVSVPFAMSSYEKNGLFPPAVSPAYSYDGSYQTKDTLVNGTGYWLKFDAPDSVTFRGYERERDTIDVKEGWNLIGGPGDQVSVESIIQIPENIIVSAFFLYGERYRETTLLLPGRGYWVKAGGNGKIVLVW